MINNILIELYKMDNDMALVFAWYLTKNRLKDFSSEEFFEYIHYLELVGWETEDSYCCFNPPF